MKRVSLFLIFLMTALCFSCMNNNQQKGNTSIPKTVVDPNNRQDTVYFGYILGQPTKSITEALIKEGKFNSPKQVKKTFSYLAWELNYEGYPFNLFIGDKSYDAFLVLADTDGQFITNDGKLMSLYIYIDGSEKQPILNELRKQYGTPNTPPQDGYSVFVPRSLDAFWNVSNKAVYLESMGGFMILVYEDIIAVTERKNKQAAEKARIERAEKQKNEEGSKNNPL